MFRRVASLTLLFAQGCYCSHELGPDDAARELDAWRPDAAETADAPEDLPPGPFWIPVDVTAFDVEHERCEAREGQTLVLRVTFTTDGCDEPGNVRWTVDPVTREIQLAPFVWRRQGVPPCPPSTRVIVRDVALRGAVFAEGAWSIVAADGTRTVVDVGAGPPELTCTDCRGADESCVVDQECEGQRECVPIRGDIACASRCASSCQPFTDVASAEDVACSARLAEAAGCREDPNLGWTCAPLGAACRTCPDGMECNTAYCDWTVTPWPEDCRTDLDCPAGRSCVELPGTFHRTCHVRCRGDHPCPLGELCSPSDVVCPIPKI